MIIRGDIVTQEDVCEVQSRLATARRALRASLSSNVPFPSFFFFAKNTKKLLGIKDSGDPQVLQPIYAPHPASRLLLSRHAR